MPDTHMSAANLAKAREHVRRVCSDGETIIVETPVSKDSFGTVLSYSNASLNAFPIRFSPFDRNITQKVTWSEDVDVVFYISEKQAASLGITLDQLKKAHYVKYKGHRYQLKYVEYYNKFGTGWLYIIIGAKK